MFTGIVEEVGRVARFDKKGKGGFLTVEAGKIIGDLGEGSSVNVDGICLTVISADASRFSAEISPETLKRGIIDSYRPGRRVNLERPLTANRFMGGHIVQGHVDASARVTSLIRRGDHADLRVLVPKEQMGYIVPKGSIALNGVSLTVATIRREHVVVALIPTTLRETNLGDCRRGDRLNLEVDIIGKYVKTFMEAYYR
ncbi:MAG: riboflavin synthase subunit alpha [Candidatus Glassbacteria bacterium RBG_16_58_8]|uniref:Riboflavin synthase n=1 Tax=Candidatus Glassbacteria bacterium RBG_16_58_8 TaxID=1817866 RepID=A0A1F5YDG8_9BACT|nr:MAG: riboflavin synthase subunit alpha [Candidatus Glassbacteria bacterium RBG_16_58_8]